MDGRTYLNYRKASRLIYFCLTLPEPQVYVTHGTGEKNV